MKRYVTDAVKHLRIFFPFATFHIIHFRIRNLCYRQILQNIAIASLHMYILYLVSKLFNSSTYAMSAEDSIVLDEAMDDGTADIDCKFFNKTTTLFLQFPKIVLISIKSFCHC